MPEYQQFEIEKKIEKLNNKKKVIRNQFINDLITIDEYHALSLDIAKQEQILNDKLKEIIENICDNIDILSYDDIKNIVTNVRLNWEHLTNKERQQFLERFVEYISVEKNNGEVVINEVEYTK